MRRLLVGVLWILGSTVFGCAGSGKPRPAPAVDSQRKEILGRLTASTSVRAYRVQGWAAEACDPDTSVSGDRIGCHPVLSGGPVMIGAWKNTFVSLLVDGISYGPVRLDPDPLFTAALRFESSAGPTDVLLSLRQRRFAILSRNLPRRSGTIVDRYPDLLRALETALPGDSEIHDLLAEVDREADTRASGGTYEAVGMYAAGCDSALVDPFDPPVSVTEIQPVYPEVAKINHVEGKVVLRVLVGEDGLVKDIRLIQGIAGPNYSLSDIKNMNDAATNAVRQWVFAPSTRYGRAVCAWVDVPIVFRY